MLPPGAPTTPPAAGDRLPVVPMPAQRVLGASPVVTEPRDALTAAARDQATAAASGPMVEPGHAGAFVLQVAAFKTEGEAQSFSNVLRQRGHRAYIESASIAGRGVWYRVRVGPFKSGREASKYRADFEAKEHMVPYVLEAEKEKRLAEQRETEKRAREAKRRRQLAKGQEHARRRGKPERRAGQEQERLLAARHAVRARLDEAPVGVLPARAADREQLVLRAADRDRVVRLDAHASEQREARLLRLAIGELHLAVHPGEHAPPVAGVRDRRDLRVQPVELAIPEADVGEHVARACVDRHGDVGERAGEVRADRHLADQQPGGGLIGRHRAGRQRLLRIARLVVLRRASGGADAKPDVDAPRRREHRDAPRRDDQRRREREPHGQATARHRSLVG
ncbi:MAG: SPOR domain-containing protein [Polyangiaceae bacterium]|nr:SPOR domain-containing protein [Polyangiaceae bacterium]